MRLPGASNQGRFQYTGQAWLPELGLYHYKARVYSPTLGRFLQADPIGYEDNANLYAYVGNDPVNRIDPLGLEDLWVTYWYRPPEMTLGGASSGIGGLMGGEPKTREPDAADIIVTGKRLPKPRGRPIRCSTETFGSDLRTLGTWLSDAGTIGQVGGAVIAVGAPPAGAFIAGAGTLAVIAGETLTAAGHVADGDWSAVGGQFFDFAVGRVTGSKYRSLARGAWRNPATGRFERNPMGGRYSKAKSEAAAAAAQKFSNMARQTIACAR